MSRFRTHLKKPRGPGEIYSALRRLCTAELTAFAASLCDDRRYRSRDLGMWAAKLAEADRCHRLSTLLLEHLARPGSVPRQASKPLPSPIRRRLAR